MGFAAVGKTLVDSYNTGKWQTKHTIDAVASGISIACPLCGVVWLGANLFWMATHKSKNISESIQEKIDEK